MQKTIYLFICLVLGNAGIIIAQPVYVNTSASLFYSPAQLSMETGMPVIYLDDVNVPSALMGNTDSLDVTGITFGFGKYGRQIPLWVDFYYTAVNPEATSLNNICAFPPVHFDSLFAYGRGVFGNLFKSYGDSVHTMFRVKATKDVLKKQYHTFFIGMSFSINSDCTMGYTHGPLYTINGTAQKTNNAATWVYDGAKGGKISKVNGLPGAFYLVVWGRPAGSSMQPVPLASGSNLQPTGTKRDEDLQWTVFPNPVGSTTQLQISLPVSSTVAIDICSQTGLPEFSLKKQTLPAGKNTLQLNLSTLPRGVHMLKMTAGYKVYYKTIYR